MRVHNTSCAPDRVDSAFVTDSKASKPRSASIHLLNAPTRPGQHRSFVRSTQTPPASRSEMTKLLADIEGLPLVVRFLVKELLAELQSAAVSTGIDIHLLLSSALEKMIDRMRGSSLARDELSEPARAAIEPLSSGEPSVRPPALPNETVLRVGPLELDLLDRTAKRGDRQIDLRPREFQLLKYMMQRSDKLLTRATLLQEVWHYRFVPETNLVDVHMGRLRRKVDRPNEAPLIRNVRGAGFVLSATPCSHGSLSRPAERSANPPRTLFQHAQHTT